jgi:hypothetical protein
LQDLPATFTQIGGSSAASSCSSIQERVISTILRPCLGCFVN